MPFVYFVGNDKPSVYAHLRGVLSHGWSPFRNRPRVVLVFPWIYIWYTAFPCGRSFSYRGLSSHKLGGMPDIPIACNGAGGRVGFEINASRAGPLMRAGSSQEFPFPKTIQNNGDATMAKIVLTRLTCHETEDNTGADECELRIWADSSYQSHRRDMNNGDVWDLNIQLEFTQRVKIQLYDLDNPGFPLYDDHDHLGTIIIRPDQLEGSNTFNQDGADYDLDWVSADSHAREASNLSFRIARDGKATFSSGATREMESLLDLAEDAESPSSEALAGYSSSSSKHTYCCSMGNDGRVSEKQQFRSYSWQAPLFCMRMARNKGYNSGSVSRGECSPDVDE